MVSYVMTEFNDPNVENHKVFWYGILDKETLSLSSIVEFSLNKDNIQELAKELQEDDWDVARSVGKSYKFPKETMRTIKKGKVPENQLHLWKELDVDEWSNQILDFRERVLKGVKVGRKTYIEV